MKIYKSLLRISTCGLVLLTSPTVSFCSVLALSPGSVDVILSPVSEMGTILVSVEKLIVDREYL